jgi:hypothetical protein
MGRAEILTPVNRDFAREVTILAREGKTLSHAYADLSERMLRFAKDFKSLWDRARMLDQGDTGTHHNHLRQALAEAIQSSDKSIRSRWIMIGSHAKKLIPHKNVLPPYRDTLYEIARALDEKKPVSKWINQKQITANSSVREVRSLRAGSGPRRRRLRGNGPSNKLRRSYPAIINFSFESYTAAAEVLSRFLASIKADMKITADQSFDAALRERLKDHDYEKAKKHFD